MTKQDMIDRMAKEARVSKAAAGRALEAYIRAVGEELKQTGKLSLVGFGTFNCVQRRARTGRNPKTGGAIQIPARKVVRFKAGKGLTDVVNI
ncbi:MAG: HU family DNA-binding protein [Syntrophales bacterium]|jgi:DNA-binding protein HU-beta|nr:HU family DNA-binding protein [Syntrophales bacterium]